MAIQQAIQLGPWDPDANRHLPSRNAHYLSATSEQSMDKTARLSVHPNLAKGLVGFGVSELTQVNRGAHLRHKTAWMN